MMDWLSKNWVWIVFALGVFLMLGRGNLGRLGPGRHFAGPGGVRDDMPDRDDRPKDPVSGDLVSPDGAINSTYQGHTYYFSSRENRDKFEAAPTQYASAAEVGKHRRRGHGC